MNIRLFILPGLFVAGIAAGLTMKGFYAPGDVASREPESIATALPAESPVLHPMASAFKVSPVSDSERIQVLEQQIAALHARIGQLEKQAITQQRASAEQPVSAVAKPNAVDSLASRRNTALTTENLLKAGIAAMQAEDIVRRKNEIDLLRLQLRDRAIREGYIDTNRYTRELDAILDRDVSLREELGDTAYDRYLYATGQTNRVNIASVMHGSPAEQAGLQAGDIILNYADRQMFSWNELRDATSGGERDEYVNVTVLRSGELFNFWMPRGPLGVRLSSRRVAP